MTSGIPTSTTMTNAGALEDCLLFDFLFFGRATTTSSSSNSGESPFSRVSQCGQTVAVAGTRSEQ
jgi:hypothetical protein